RQQCGFAQFVQIGHLPRSDISYRIEICYIEDRPIPENCQSRGRFAPKFRCASFNSAMVRFADLFAQGEPEKLLFMKRA
ncbi:hypothetical protein, partial [Bradyrhizobium sp. 17]|uniref:hypothetical protein n=1 Tax=Bradyrhizobium sp. 17 TaxID=2782649 RepID=UPI001FFBF171